MDSRRILQCRQFDQPRDKFQFGVERRHPLVSICTARGLTTKKHRIEWSRVSRKRQTVALGFESHGNSILVRLLDV